MAAAAALAARLVVLVADATRLFLEERLPVGDRDLVIVGVDFREGEEAVAVAAVVDEGGLQRRFDPRDLRQIDVAAQRSSCLRIRNRIPRRGYLLSTTTRVSSGWEASMIILFAMEYSLARGAPQRPRRTAAAWRRRAAVCWWWRLRKLGSGARRGVTAARPAARKRDSRAAAAAVIRMSWICGRDIVRSNQGLIRLFAQ